MKNVCLVGNPNTGKTTLFNNLTSSNEHVGNWHGVTVEEKGKVIEYKGDTINIVDLPGIYSLSPLSFEEEVAKKYLFAHTDYEIVNICDASNLMRNLYLTLCLLEKNFNVILVVNQIDKRPICKVDYVKLSKILGVKIIYCNVSDKSSKDEIFNSLYEKKNDNKIKLPYIKNSIDNDKDFEELAQARYDYIDCILNDVSTPRQRVYGQSKLDNVFLNKFFALPIFLLLLAGVFYLTFFSLGEWLSDVLATTLDTILFTPIVKGISSLFGSQSWIVGLVENAIVGGVGAIVSFLPQVGLLFLFLSILEDSGYLARIAFMFDDILSKVGLSGKAVYTLLMGFGCSTSAVLTARNMEDKNSKIKTALLTPYMSCSAKFPIYSVLGGAFFGARNIWVILGLYLLGIVVAVLISYIFEKTCLKSKQQSFILEFSAYRMISLKRTSKLLLQNVKLFLSRVGGLIIAMNIIVWVLSNFSVSLKYIPSSGGESFLQTFGKIISPIFVPLGFGSWALVASLLAGLVAKEVVVSSIAMFNGASSNLELKESLLSLTAVAGFVNASSLLSFLVFCLLYVPCMATMGVLTKEIGWKWTWFSIGIEFAVAYIASFIVYNISSACEIFGMTKVLILLLIIFSIVIAFVLVGKHFIKRKGCPYKGKCLKDCKKK